MNTEQRQHCLAALGVVQYLPRDSWQLAVSSAPAQPKLSKVAAPAAAQALLAELSSDSPSAAQQPVAARSTPAAAEPALIATPPTTVSAPASPAAAPVPPAEPVAPLRLALWQADQQWLFIADVSQQLPTNAEQQLLANIASALNAPRLSALELVEWPLAGDSSAAADDPLGHEFLAVLMDARLQSRPVKRVALFSDGDLLARIGAGAGRAMAGLAQVALPPLSAQLADGGCKRRCWQSLKPYAVASGG